jgi:hypothetical protein
MHQGTYYSVPGQFYSFLADKILFFRINGLDTDLLIDTCFTTTDGSFQELKISFINWAPDRLQTYVDQLSTLLGFKPSAQVSLDAQAKVKYSSWPIWTFKDYTVALIQYSFDFAITQGNPYSLFIIRHYPNTATPLYNVPLAPWK